MFKKRADILEFKNILSRDITQEIIFESDQHWQCKKLHDYAVWYQTTQCTFVYFLFDDIYSSGDLS